MVQYQRGGYGGDRLIRSVLCRAAAVAGGPAVRHAVLQAEDQRNQSPVSANFHPAESVFKGKIHTETFGKNSQWRRIEDCCVCCIVGWCVVPIFQIFQDFGVRKFASHKEINLVFILSMISHFLMGTYLAFWCFPSFV